MPLKACERLMRISAYFGGPQTVGGLLVVPFLGLSGAWVWVGEGGDYIPVMYGLAAVSSDPRPLPMMKMQVQKPPKE
jgi:hypothetical protein